MPPPAHPKPPEVTENEIRIRIREPGLFRPDTFRRITIDRSKGIFAIAGKIRADRLVEGDNPDAMVIQSFRFDKKKWTAERAAAWVRNHLA